MCGQLVCYSTTGKEANCYRPGSLPSFLPAIELWEALKLMNVDEILSRS